jgi:hypothetical protein
MKSLNGYDRPMKAVLRTLAVMGALCICVGCRHAQPLGADKQCVANMLQLMAAARSHALENRLPDSTIVSPQDLAGFLQAPLPKCRLGDAPYAPFAIKTGPVCPNDASHTAEFRKEWARVEERQGK